MKFRFASLFASVALLATPALAQDIVRSYDLGPVWAVENIQIKPGHFDEYMHFLATTWKAEQEDSRRRGWVLDYKVLNAVDPRDNEPDIFLMIEYKNMAVMDTSLDELEAQTKKLSGTLTAANKAFGDRDKIRTERGSLLLRELTLR
jgi:hypothetical protein